MSEFVEVPVTASVKRKVHALMRELGLKTEDEALTYLLDHHEKITPKK